MPNNNCPVCESPLQESLRKWHFFCPRCAYEQSSLEPAINENQAYDNIDEAARETGLRELRLSNFRILLGAIGQLKPEGGSLLDVGSAHGWFVEEAMDTYEVLGIEPDEAICAMSAARGLPVRNGYFPDALRDGETFDVIVFNDVLEHIPPVIDILRACHERLNDGGYLVVNLPNSKGLFYRVSRVFARLGYSGFFERLWQKDLPSPHVHYFNEYNLADLIERNGFVTAVKGRLPVVSLSGLYSRISFAGKMGGLAKAVTYCAVALSLPLLKLFPNDIIYLIAKKA
jgi:2-polyprenyl-3-methyl-5-hydroxy-6-metoxy-1,4-benzoquinol methylase